nr:MAG TPA: hypothetical protein [Caudoviricetes sp.]
MILIGIKPIRFTPFRQRGLRCITGEAYPPRRAGWPQRFLLSLPNPVPHRDTSILAGALIWRGIYSCRSRVQ